MRWKCSRTCKSGKLRVLVVMTPVRSGIFPDVPTVAESGFPGFEASVWYGFIGPAGLPAPVVAKLHAEIERALASDDVKGRLAAAGGEVLPGARRPFRRVAQRRAAALRKADPRCEDPARLSACARRERGLHSASALRRGACGCCWRCASGAAMRASVAGGRCASWCRFRRAARRTSSAARSRRSCRRRSASRSSSRTSPAPAARSARPRWRAPRPTATRC